jgi:hypothetical protein
MAVACNEFSGTSRPWKRRLHAQQITPRPRTTPRPNRRTGLDRWDGRVSHRPPVHARQLDQTDQFGDRSRHHASDKFFVRNRVKCPFTERNSLKSLNRYCRMSIPHATLRSCHGSLKAHRLTPRERATAHRGVSPCRALRGLLRRGSPRCMASSPRFDGRPWTTPFFLTLSARVAYRRPDDLW